MDAVEILSKLLRKKSPSGEGGGLGTKILKDLLGGGGTQKQNTEKPTSGSSRGTTTSRNFDVNSSGDIQRHAKELEDLLNVGSRRSTGTTSPPAPPPRPSQSRAGQSSLTEHTRPDISATGSTTARSSSTELLAENERALVLIRAMINAAKADGQITRDEEQKILGQIENPTQEVIEFLRREVAVDVSVKDFVWSVPRGMEEQVYLVALMTIRLDSQAEAKYLGDLAFGLRLSKEFCNQVHQQVGAPNLF